MNIFDPLITGSLSVSGSGEISGDLTVLGTINATVSGTTSNAISASHAAEYLLTSSFEQFSGSYTTGSFTGSFIGDGSELYNIPASGVTGLNLSRISEGGVTASISETNGLVVNTNTEITGSLTVTGSILLNGKSLDERLDSIEVESGSIRTDFNTYTSSNDSINTTQNDRLHDIETSTGSLNSFTSSIDTTIKNKLNSDGVISGSVQVDITETTGYPTFSSSIKDTTTNIENRLTFLETESGSIRSDFNSYTSSNNSTNSTQNGRLDSLESTSGSLENSTSSLNSFTASIDTTIKTKLNNDGVISGSIQVNIDDTTGYNTFSSSLSSSIGLLSGSITTTTNNLSASLSSLSESFSLTKNDQENRITTIESHYATTGSNYFVGNQTITGSLYISQNLIVQGSSSLENITASAVSIGTNTIILNTDTPAFRYAGISVFDSGSTNVTASLFYDSLTNQWKFKRVDVDDSDASILIFGPLGNDIDNTPLLVGNYLTKVENDGHGHHITTSSIFDDGSKVSIDSSVEITGSIIITGTIKSDGTPLVSGSSQIILTGTTGFSDFSSSISSTNDIQNGRISNLETASSSIRSDFNSYTSSNNTTNNTQNNRLNSLEVSTGSLNTFTSSALTRLGELEISTGSLNSFTSSINTTIKNRLNAENVVSGSSQISFGGISGVPTGLVSGSSQVLDGTTIHSGAFFNGIPVVSGSAQISFNGITDKPTLVSGSSQITFGSISGIPGGLVSGSSQIDLTATTNYSSGIKTRLNAEGVISGSSQVTGIANSQLVNSSFNIGTTSISLGRASATQTLSGVSIDGNAASATEVIRTVGGGSEANLLYATIADNDFFRIRVGGGSNAGFVEIATADDGTEPIHVRQYTGVFSSLTRTATLLDGSGNTSFPGTVTAPTFSGSLSGNASTVTNGVYTSGNQTIGGSKTFSNTILASDGLSVGSNGVINSSGNISFSGVATTTNQNRGIYWTGYDKEGTTDFSDAAYIRHTTNSGGLDGSVVEISSQNDANDGVNFLVNSTASGVRINGNAILNASNFSSYALPLGGGTLTTNVDQGLTINKTSGGSGQWNYIGFSSVGTRRAYFGIDSGGSATIGSDIGSIILQNNTNISGNFTPSTNNTHNLGSPSLGWANVYTNDLHLSNMNKPEGNDIDGTKGNWTIQEGAENLYIINNNNGKKFKISLEEL